MSYVTCLELIYTILANTKLTRGRHFCNHAISSPLLNHSVSKHNYERLFPIRFRIIKKQVIRVHTSSLHHNCHIYNYNYSTSIEHRDVAAGGRNMFPCETSLHINSCAEELSVCCQIPRHNEIPKHFSCRFDCYSKI